MSPVDIGQRVRLERKSLGLTQKDLAGLCNVGVRFISELENGKKTLEIGKVLKVMQGLGLDINVNERKVKE